MKTFVIFISFCFFAFNLKAQFGRSVVVIQSQNGLPFTASMNNGAPVQPTTQINFTQVQPGNHFLEVFRAGGTFFGAANNLQTIFRGMIQVPANMQQIYIINHLNQLVLAQSTPLTMQGLHHANQFQQPMNQIHVGGHGPGMINNPHAGMHGNMAWGMHPQTFQQLLATINATGFDSNRRNIAKQAISTNGVSSQQVLEIIRRMSFESTRLDVAKFAYPFTVDRQNYFIVNNGFSFNSSINQLNRFIAQSF